MATDQLLVTNIFIIYKKTLTTIHFKGKFDHTNSLFSESRIIRLRDKICIQNYLFISKSLHNQLPKIFNDWFVFSSDTHRYEIFSEKGMLELKSFNTESYGKEEEAVICSAISTWNSLQKNLKHFLLRNLSTFQLKKFLNQYYLKKLLSTSLSTLTHSCFIFHAYLI